MFPMVTDFLAFNLAYVLVSKLLILPNELGKQDDLQGWDISMGTRPVLVPPMACLEPRLCGKIAAFRGVKVLLRCIEPQAANSQAHLDSQSWDFFHGHAIRAVCAKFQTNNPVSCYKQQQWSVISAYRTKASGVPRVQVHPKGYIAQPGALSGDFWCAPNKLLISWNKQVRIQVPASDDLIKRLWYM